ncbi:facilitated trehalose transporter Tret1 isoform X2 [Leptopilina heterotoma]|uniref:facilitated trehalose transporter Tret1 isoform X2 n=1 Tax=Leptopilina heterotoma TaxID=63436 RepID=UPI001CA839CA|nr:facilitated trehalose transporter Tret1 isoform X2 [Leptopilina heterotoma]
MSKFDINNNSSIIHSIINVPMDHAILPNYKRVHTLAPNSNLELDCASNTTLLTSVSSFNSQVDLIEERKKNLSINENQKSTTKNYYAENLKINHQNPITRAQIYDPLGKGSDTNYKQLDPLLKDSQSHDNKDIMELENAKDKVSFQFGRGSSKKISFYSKYATQVMAALSVSLASMIIGYSSSFPSVAVQSMNSTETNTPFKVDDEIESWIGSIMPLSALFGGFAGGPSIEYLGRRTTILMTAIPFIASGFLIGLANNIPQVLVGRAVCGFSIGVASLALPVYLGETIQPEVRGTLGILPTALGNMGILLCFTAGMFLDWSSLSFLGGVLPIPFLILTFIIPETPRWYVSKGKTKKAREALQWFRGKNTDISDEMAAVERAHIDSEKNETESSFFELFRGTNLKPFLISLGLMLFQQFSGINAVVFYAIKIFKDAGSTIDNNICAIILGVVNFLSTFVATILIDRAGRKLLLYVSSILMTITLIALGTFFYFKNFNYDLTPYGWIPLVSMIIYMIGFSLGFGPIPWLMMGEILPAKIRGSAASVITSFNWFCTFGVTKTFPDVINLIGINGAFWLFGIVCFIALIFVKTCVPETQGRSLEEIESGLTGKTRRMSAVANMKPMPTAC